MGNLLGSPVTEKETETGITPDGLAFAVSSMQGWRVHMEDAHVAETSLSAIQGETSLPLPNHALFAVLDGHGGTFAASYGGRNLHRVLQHQPAFFEYAKSVSDSSTTTSTTTQTTEPPTVLERALQDALVALDREVLLAVQGSPVPDADLPAPDESPDSGSTICVVLITPHWIVCANAGDSRAILGHNTLNVVPLSTDHKPEDDDEVARIRAAGGFVAAGRVEGDLAVSRGLGDYRYKEVAVVLAGSNGTSSNRTPASQKVSPVPDVTFTARTPDDAFVLLACDGIWDVQTNPQAAQLVSTLFSEGERDLGLVCEEVCDTCLALGSKDNMTALVVKCAGQVIGVGGGGVAERRRQREAAANPPEESPQETTTED